MLNSGGTQRRQSSSSGKRKVGKRLTHLVIHSNSNNDQATLAREAAFAK